jgi:hypothetical protein
MLMNAFLRASARHPRERDQQFESAFLQRRVCELSVPERRRYLRIHFRPTRLSTLLDIAAMPSPSESDDETQILSVGYVLFRERLTRVKLLDFLAVQTRCVVAMEAWRQRV